VGQGLLIVEVSRLHSVTPQSLGLLWTSDQPVTGTSTGQHTHSQQTDINAPGGFRTRIPTSQRPQQHTLDRAAAGVGSRPNVLNYFLFFYACNLPLLGSITYCGTPEVNNLPVS